MHTIWSHKTWTSRSPARTSCLIAVRTRPTSSPSLPALTDYHYGHSDHSDHHYHQDHHQVTFPCRVRNQHNLWASGPTLLGFSPSPFSSVFRINHSISYNVSIKSTSFFLLEHPMQNVPLWTSSCQSGILASLFKSTISTTEYLPSSLSWSHYLHNVLTQFVNKNPKIYQWNAGE